MNDSPHNKPLFEITDEMVDEAYLYKADLHWQKDGRFEMAKFQINDVSYVIQLETLPNVTHFNVPDFKGSKIAEVSFFIQKAVDIETSFSDQKDHQPAAMKVYSATMYGVADKFDEYDVFFFIAERRHSKDGMTFEQKTRIHRSLVAAMKSTKRFHYYEHEDNTKSTFIVSKIKLSEDSEREYKLIHPLKEAMMAVGLDVAGFNL